MVKKINKHWPIFCAIGIYWGVITLLTIMIYREHGFLIYPLDDTYIHMAIAKNVALYNTWGISRFGFSSSTSSPLWTLLLSIVYRIAGVNDLAPLGLNLLFGTLTLWITYYFLNAFVRNLVWIFLVLCIAIFVTPLPTITMVGMEHTLQIFLTLCYVYLTLGLLVTGDKVSRMGYATLLLLALLISMARYECLFLVFVVSVLLLLQRKIILAIVQGGCGLILVVLYGIWSVSQGWYFIPNSLILKGNVQAFSVKSIIKMISGYNALWRMDNNPHILLLMVLVSFFLLTWVIKERGFDKKKFLSLIFIGTTGLHMQFAQTGWFYRYEAYIVLLGILIVGIGINQLLLEGGKWKFEKAYLPRYLAGAALVFVIAVPFGFRARNSLIEIPIAAQDRYHEHIQIEHFIKKYYSDSVVVVNDLGAVAYFTDAKVLDMFGLGNIEPVAYRYQTGDYTSQDVYDWTKGAKIAILQVEWGEIAPRIPSEWKRIGTWELPGNIVWGDVNNKIGFYAIENTEINRLSQNLKAFSVALPEDVKLIYDGISGHQS